MNCNLHIRGYSVLVNVVCFVNYAQNDAIHSAVEKTV